MTNTPTPPEGPHADLDAITARADAATPGPWETSGPNIEQTAANYETVVGLERRGMGYMSYDVLSVKQADAEFIAHSREDVSALVAEVRALRAALSDSVPREQYDLTVLESSRQLSNMRDERDEARAERDAHAHVLANAPHGKLCGYWQYACTCWKSTVPAVSLARHDAEVWDDASREHVEKLSRYIRDDGLIDQHIAVIGLSRLSNPHRDAALREGAGS